MKANFVIDASGIYYRSLFSMSSYKKPEDSLKLLSTEESKGVLMRKLATDFSALIRSVDGLSRVIIALDASSWRKHVPEEVIHELSEGDYKGNRTKDEDSPIDWDSFYAITDEFAEIMSSKGYIISQVPNAEADDLLYLWSKKLNGMGENVILVTGDKDLLQCISQNENETWTVALDPVSKRRKISAIEATLNYKPHTVEEVDVFDVSTYNDTAFDILTKLLASNDVQTINPEDVRYEKVTLGDGGDNVPALFTWVAKNKNGEDVIRWLTAHKRDKAISKTGFTYTLEDFERVYYGKEDDALIAKLDALRVELEKICPVTMSIDSFLKRIKRNYLLVVLNDDTIPQDIQNAFILSTEEVANSPVHLGRDFILEGTKWWTNKDKGGIIPKSFDLF